jgi:hypothetical protein
VRRDGKVVKIIAPGAISEVAMIHWPRFFSAGLKDRTLDLPRCIP